VRWHISSYCTYIQILSKSDWEKFLALKVSKSVGVVMAKRGRPQG
jgi:hypothetical protein